MGPCVFPLHWTRERARPPPALVDSAPSCCRGCSSKGPCYLGTLQPQVNTKCRKRQRAKLTCSWQRHKAHPGRAMASEAQDVAPLCRSAADPGPV